ncbi:hypothetical protein Droror1_Dr00020834 [Drosera rotundifolia]
MNQKQTIFHQNYAQQYKNSRNISTNATQTQNHHNARTAEFLSSAKSNKIPRPNSILQRNTKRHSKNSQENAINKITNSIRKKQTQLNAKQNGQHRRTTSNEETNIEIRVE